jgi:hypothetical protein
MPRPGTQVIPTGWAAYHRPTAEATMTDTVELRRPSSASVFDEAAGSSAYPDPTTLATTSARIQRLPRRGGSDDVGDRAVVVQLYQVSLPVSAPEVRIDDQVYVTTAATDPQLVGVLLTVREVRLGSQVWQRDLMCEEVTPMTR